MPHIASLSADGPANQGHLPGRALGRTVPGVPSWAGRAAAAVVWASLPSALWRLAAVLGVPLGLGRSEYDAMLIPGWGLLVLPLLSSAQGAWPG